MASSNIHALINSCKTSDGDECYTPSYALEVLLPYLDKNKTYYEATSNISSNIITCANINGFNFIESNGRDFLKDDLPAFDAIITNPPYSIKDKFIEKCYQLDKPFALLLPVTAIQGKFRGNLFSKYGIELLILNSRVDFTGKGAPHFGVAWFCKNILPSNLIFTDIKKTAL
jgi:hypothetical protein